MQLGMFKAYFSTPYRSTQAVRFAASAPATEPELVAIRLDPERFAKLLQLIPPGKVALEPRAGCSGIPLNRDGARREG